MYDLGSDGQGMSRVATVSQSSIVAAAGNIARYAFFPLHFMSILFAGNHFFISFKLFFVFRTIDRSVFKPIVQISVIDRFESSDCHLLAVTHAGKGYRRVK